MNDVINNPCNSLSPSISAQEGEQFMEQWTVFTNEAGEIVDADGKLVYFTPEEHAMLSFETMTGPALNDGEAAASGGELSGGDSQTIAPEHDELLREFETHCNNQPDTDLSSDNAGDVTAGLIQTERVETVWDQMGVAGPSTPSAAASTGPAGPATSGERASKRPVKRLAAVRTSNKKNHSTITKTPAKRNKRKQSDPNSPVNRFRENIRKQTDTLETEVIENAKEIDAKKNDLIRVETAICGLNRDPNPFQAFNLDISVYEEIIQQRFLTVESKKVNGKAKSRAHVNAVADLVESQELLIKKLDSKILLGKQNYKETRDKMVAD